MAQYSPGELKKFYYIPEATYGTTPTDALTWGCDIISLKPSVNANKDFHTLRIVHIRDLWCSDERWLGDRLHARWTSARGVWDI